MPSPPLPETPARGGNTSSVLWTLMLGLALIALAAAPKRERAGRPPSPDEASATSHVGLAARRVAATESDRGRDADHPGEIPPYGWRDIAFRIYEKFTRDRVLAVAAGVTFFTLLSLFPAIAALVACYGLVADAGTINQHLALLQGFLPLGAIEIIGDQVKRISAKGGGSLSFTFLFSLGVSLWSANAAMKALFDALNIVYEEQEKRSFVALNLLSLVFTLGALLFVVLALSAIVVLPLVFNFVGIGDSARAIAVLRWPGLLLVLLGGLTLVYRYGPSRQPARWHWVGLGGAVAGILWLTTSIAFSWYVANFGNYNETYGSLGAAIGFMTWIWISVTIVLLGGEINAEVEHQTSRDSTTGPALPLGKRNAHMADTIGVSA